MDNHAVVQMKAIAKERGIRGYHKLRKAVLIHALEATRLVEQKSNIFGELIPNDSTIVLRQTPWRPSIIALKNKIFFWKISLQKHAKDTKFLCNGYAKD